MTNLLMNTYGWRRKRLNQKYSEERKIYKMQKLKNPSNLNKIKKI